MVYDQTRYSEILRSVGNRISGKQINLDLMTKVVSISINEGLFCSQI